MKILEFLQDNKGQFSSMRLIAITFAAVIISEGVHEIWWLGKVWQPSFESVGLIVSMLGIKQVQNKTEKENK